MAFGQLADLDLSRACNPEAVFTLAEEMPAYAKGKKQLKKDLKALYHLDKRISGTLFAKFIINCKGEAISHRVIKGIDSYADKLIQESSQTLQDWTPGRQEGNPIDCIFILPIKIEYGRYKKS